jgi:hypothetical protein
MLKDTLVTTLEAVGKLPDFFRSVRSDSLIEYTRVTRAEPIVLMGNDVVHLPYAHDVMQSLNAIFAGYYLQAVAISVNVGKIDVIKMLEKVNPARSPMENAGMLIGDIVLSEESYQHKLPDIAAIRRVASMEASRDELEDVQAMTLGKNTTVTATDMANLSVGMLLEVNVESEGNKASIPVAVRLMVSSIANDTLRHILSYAEKDKSMKERFHGWRSGRLSFWKDMMFAQDLIDEHRRARIKDKSGVYDAVLKRSRNNRLSGLLSGQPSVATASNIIVMTKQSAAQLESEIGARLSDYRVRERIFENTYVMLMVVVDTEFEHVTIYHRSLALPSQMTIKELKSANRKGHDVAEILKAYTLGNAPTI